ncbi:hypothetical protein HMF7854_08570 [Sphingomonas ginkgonis]|uniref:Uncharacterized protein n=1 Tax=Sphingomonas ginkgonis TaxID=2315330 RepID=A0A3R9YIV5_9SPHN|nr:hypothetical protein HMF7854_08570 [Sphingomonas ginkgonis]
MRAGPAFRRRGDAPAGLNCKEEEWRRKRTSRPRRRAARGPRRRRPRPRRRARTSATRRSIRSRRSSRTRSSPSW